MSEVLKSLVLGLRKSPHNIVVILIVGAFLLYLYRHDTIEYEKAKLDDLVAKQRIENCHSTQERSTLVMEKLNDTLINHDKAFVELLFSIRQFKDSLNKHSEKFDENSKKMDALIGKISLLEASIDKVNKPSPEMIEVFKDIKKELSEINKKMDNT